MRAMASVREAAAWALTALSIKRSGFEAVEESTGGLQGSLDVLRDEGEAYARRLNAAGVAVTSVRYNGMIHDYGLLNVVAEVPAVRSAMDQAAQALKNSLK